MLNDEIIKYTKLTGEDGSKVPISRLGGFLDGYDKGRNDAINDVIHWLYEAEINNIDYPQFCKGLERAREIAELHREEVE